jgi:pyrimidine operon attenuation protein/uracil phosphoribosyltransferase
MRELLTPSDALAGLRRMAIEMQKPVGRPVSPTGLLLVGIRRGGVPLAEHLAQLLREAGSLVEVGSVDMTLYRDDAATTLPSTRIGQTEMPVDVGGRRIILVDDVLYTGRTVRAALDELLDYGRPACVELAVLVDRGGRELPIQPTYAVLTEAIPPTERVEVLEAEGAWRAIAEDLPK